MNLKFIEGGKAGDKVLEFRGVIGSASSGPPPPAIYTSPASHTDTPSPSTIVSPPVSPAEKTWIQRVVGSLLFYARALDLSILTAVCQLSSYQSNPTQLELTAAHRLLNYVSSHPTPHKTIKLSTPHPWLSGPAPTPATCLDLSRAVWLVVRSDSETHPTTSSTRPQKVVDKASERNSPLSVPPALSNHTLLTHPLPPLPTMPPSTPFASAYRWWLRLWQRRSMPRLVGTGKCWLSSRSP
jgi:hypothetical protein